ncbi:hypothetical protein W97_00042 [Coniosporium apollinis CBS 100218]|uniref:NAD(P)-binding domain-containing protein n=1 Tax=Coniosporium apollinis (strain CBS 100218) TaxID=1168221 RepID=R7YG19_CONA1|nr:uncharacterized protein W97_00042 [Coniosporium apollinis CBS 100218]EON60833.1 hypothetical protein W97_00042 [Coniosporium apollinis CBS 100218]
MSHRVLLIGGHGKISQLVTPMLLSRSWAVTSLIRDTAQESTILKLGADQPGKLDVLVRSLEEVKSEDEAKDVIDQVKPDWVIWSAGAGGKGGPSRTFAIDRDAASHFIRASAATPAVKKFIMISYLGSRRNKAPWWSDDEWANTQKTNQGALKNYFEAKVTADEVLTACALKRDDFKAVDLRPGMLTDQPAGKVQMGKTKAGGDSSRASVAEAIVACLENEAAKGWLDILDGEEDIKEVVERCVREGVDCVEGEDLERIKRLV